MTLGAFGLSAAAVTQAFKFFFAENENIDGFLLFLSIVLASLSFLGMLAVRHVSRELEFDTYQPLTELYLQLPPEENKPQSKSLQQFIRESTGSNSNESSQ
jgi:hypothetical protein